MLNAKHEYSKSQIKTIDCNDDLKSNSTLP